jgi:signal peptidase I
MAKNEPRTKTLEEIRKEDASTTVPKKPVKKKDGFWRSLIIAALIAIGIRSFFVEAFRIPTGSMKNSLLVGDYLFVNKLAYSFKSPKYLPFTNIEIPHIGVNTFHVSRGDVVVFEFPGNRDQVILSKREKNVNYIKRCIGTPGDTIEVKNKQVYVNGSPMKNPEMLVTSNDTMRKGQPEPGSNLFPKGNYTWNRDNYGPIRIPKKGDVISLDANTYDAWAVIIQREGHTVRLGDNGAILIDDIPVKSYTIERDYLWMMGDNRDNSLDSRYWGFAPVDNVVGNALFIYWSMFNPPYDPGEGDPDEVQKFNIRWGRILNGVH